MTIYLKSAAAAAMLGLFAWGAAAQGPNLHTGEESRAAKALSAEQTRDLLEGRGMGLAKAAEINRYPGPMHVLKLADPLELSEADAVAVEALTAKIGGLQGKFRAVHLKVHLAARPMLAAETIARYDSLRGYAGEADRSQDPGANAHRH